MTCLALRFCLTLTMSTFCESRRRNPSMRCAPNQETCSLSTSMVPRICLFSTPSTRRVPGTVLISVGSIRRNMKSKPTTHPVANSHPRDLVLEALAALNSSDCCTGSCAMLFCSYIIIRSHGQSTAALAPTSASRLFVSELPTRERTGFTTRYVLIPGRAGCIER